MDMNAFSLKGKIAWITGASYGIGFAIAEAYAAAGATIVFNDINQELVDKGLKSYAEKGIDAKGYVCDVTNEEAVQALVKQIEQEIGTIDILVNNAGIIRRIPMIEMSAAEFRERFASDRFPWRFELVEVVSRNFFSISVRRTRLSRA